MYLEKEKSTELYKRIENLMYKYSGKKRMMLRRKITKEDSQRLYGLATLMMVYHHLFCIPERMGGYIYTIDLLLKANGIGLRISWFCKICVALFAFISGYGSASKCVHDKNIRIKQQIRSDYSYAGKHIFSLMKKYWLVFMAFIPYGLITGKIEFCSVKVFLLNLVGLKASYNREWWYVRQYLLMMLMFPIINALSDKVVLIPSKVRKLLTYCLIIVVSAIGFGYWKGDEFANDVVSLVNRSLVVYSIIFIEGVYYKKIEKLKNENLKHIRYGKVIAAGGLLIVILLRNYFASSAGHCMSDIFVVMPFVFCMIWLLDNSNAANVLIWFGKYSTYIWLTHTFFCYYYFQTIIVSAKFSILMFAETVALSTITGIVLTYIERIIDGKIVSHC